MEAIKATPIVNQISNSKDLLVWKDNLNEEFNLKSAYSLANKHCSGCKQNLSVGASNDFRWL